MMAARRQMRRTTVLYVKYHRKTRVLVLNCGHVMRDFGNHKPGDRVTCKTCFFRKMRREQE